VALGAVFAAWPERRGVPAPATAEASADAPAAASARLATGGSPDA